MTDNVEESNPVSDNNDVLIEFIELLRSKLGSIPEDSRLVMSQFRGDPYEDTRGKWRVKVLSDPDLIDERANVYVCVSAMGRNDRGEIRRRKENFRAGMLLMIDDLGTGPGAKFPLSTVDALPPTLLVETSPDNFQAIYVFKEPVTDQATFAALIRAFIAQEFLDAKDPGMAGINRVFRPPVGVNGKAKYEGGGVRPRDWRPDNQYTVEDLVKAYDLTLIKERKLPTVFSDPLPALEDFQRVYEELKECGMVKREHVDIAGWVDIVCPWTANHTGGVDNGASIRMPNPENQYQGAFKCHHGSCEGKGWRHMTNWLAKGHEEILADINQRAPKRASAWDCIEGTVQRNARLAAEKRESKINKASV